jgi:hypothetical protein
VPDARALVDAVAGQVELTTIDRRRIRAVTHLDVDAAVIDRALLAISAAL